MIISLVNDKCFYFSAQYHFDSDQWEIERVDRKRKLKWNAVPTIFGDQVNQVTRPSIPKHQSMMHAS